MKTKNSIELKLWTAFIVMIIFFTVLWTCSCSPQQALTEPGNGYKTVRTENNKAVVYSGTKEFKIKNKAKYEVDSNDFLILRQEFRCVGGIYP